MPNCEDAASVPSADLTDQIVSTFRRAANSQAYVAKDNAANVWRLLHRIFTEVPDAKVNDISVYFIAGHLDKNPFVEVTAVNSRVGRASWPFHALIVYRGIVFDFENMEAVNNQWVPRLQTVDEYVRTFFSHSGTAETVRDWSVYSVNTREFYTLAPEDLHLSSLRERWTKNGALLVAGMTSAWGFPSR